MTKFKTWNKISAPGMMPFRTEPNACNPALITSVTSNRKPKVATRPRLAARARTIPLRPVLGVAFQIALSAVCISPNTPLAVISRVTRPITVAQIPLFLLLALAIMV